VRPHDVTLRLRRCARESLQWFLAGRLHHGARDKRSRMVSSHNDQKHTDPRHPLPDFSLQNSCKFAVHAAAWSIALATGATQKHARVLTL
jgi:hypothetical protein